MSVLQHRRQFNASAKRLRRARRLYLRLCTPAIMACEDNTVLHHVIQRMNDHELYKKMAKICWREQRYSICRYLWRQAGGNSHSAHWFFWLKQNGFDHNFNRNLNVSKAS